MVVQPNDNLDEDIGKVHDPIDQQEDCSFCDGIGLMDDSNECPYCDGTGETIR